MVNIVSNSIIVIALRVIRNNRAKQTKEKAIEQTLWESANKLRGSVEPAEYKHVVFGLIFLKFASDKFEEHRKAMR